MTATETGHAKNIANFDQLITLVSAYGATYNPSKTAITLPQLHVLASAAKQSINNLNVALPNYSNAVANREVVFSLLKKLVIRLVDSLKATDASIQVIENVKTITRKLQGRRAKPVSTTTSTPQEINEPPAAKTISVSQLSYDNRLANFDKLIQLLSSIEEYAPNESDLTVAGLKAFFANLEKSNNALTEASTKLSEARIARNNTLYQASTGLVAIASATKSYIRSVYGASSPQYKQLSKLEFVKLKSK